jgi:hypothetical protein
LVQKEDNVTEEMPSEQADLVDVFHAPVRQTARKPRGSICTGRSGMARACDRLIGCTEKEAGKFVQGEATKVKQEILARVNASNRIGDGMRQQLCESIENFFDDRERRHRLMHDEWYVSLVAEPTQAIPMIRGLSRKKDAKVGVRRSSARRCLEPRSPLS